MQCGRPLKGSGIRRRLSTLYDFRNKLIAHHDEELKDIERRRTALKGWIALLLELHAIAPKVAPK